MFDGISMQDLLMNVCRLAPISVAFVSMGGSFVKVNPALCGMLGYEEEELLGLSFHDFANPDSTWSDNPSISR